MKLISTDEINDRLKNDSEGFIAQAEKEYTNAITEIAATLKENLSEKPIVLLSGPSGSGKTTSALRIESLLDGWGSETHTLSMDSYFLPESQTPEALDENGKMDYESPLRLDTKLLNEHLEILANCGEVEVPKFNFAKQQREPGHTLKRNPGEIVVVEGIHALNPDITGKSYEFATGIYVSVRTRIQDTSGRLLHPSKIRVMRRLIRDGEHRGRQPEQTLDMFRSVQRGEDLYIMPYKYRAHFEIDTFFPYEISVYRDRLIPIFEKLKDSYAGFEGFAEIPGFLREIRGISQQLVPEDALIREFVGGSSLKYT